MPPRICWLRMAVAKGERFRVLEDHVIGGLSQWRAPFTGSFECTLPEGLVLVCPGGQKSGAVGFGCVPEDYEAGERLLVPKDDREHPKFDGYYFVLLEAEIGTWFDRA
jgi:hypothetical protein